MDRRGFLAGAIGGVALVALEPSAIARRLGGTRLAYVTADLESHVALVDLTSAKVVRRIRTSPGPRSIESVHDRYAVAAHSEHGMLSVLDVAQQGAVRHELQGFEEPRYSATHPALDIAYVTDSSRREVAAVDVRQGRILSRARVPGAARHVTISPGGRRLWTALGSTASGVALLDARDPRRLRLERVLRPPFLAHDVVCAPDGETVWITSGDERRIAVYKGGQLLKVIRADAPPQHVAFTRGLAFVASGDDGTLRRYRADGTLVGSVQVPLGSYNVTFGWDRVVTPSLGRGTLAIGGSGGRVAATVTVARAAHDACIVLGV